MDSVAITGCAGAAITTTVNVCDGEQALFGTVGVAVTVYVPAVVNVKDALGLLDKLPTDGNVVQSQLKGTLFCSALNSPGEFSQSESGPEILKSGTTCIVSVASPSHSKHIIAHVTSENICSRTWEADVLQIRR
jgi:hypothetical protein